MYLSFTIDPPGDAHDFYKERSALRATKIGAGNVIIKIIMTFPINHWEISARTGKTLSELFIVYTLCLQLKSKNFVKNPQT